MSSTTDDRRPDKAVPGSDATSKETLEDLKDKDSSAGEQNEQHDTGVPSPDGAFDEKKEVGDSGPM